MYSVFSNNINTIYRINIRLSLFLINYFSNKKTRLILIGTAAEYGVTSYKKKLKETDILKPKNYYGLSKSIQSTILLEYSKIISTKSIVLRIFNMYGDIYAKHLLIGKINNNIKKGNNLFKLGSLKDFRDYISTEKASRMIIKCLLRAKINSVYNIGSGKVVEVRDIIKKYFKIIKLKNYKIIEKKSYINANYSCANIDKYKNILWEKYHYSRNGYVGFANGIACAMAKNNKYIYNVIGLENNNIKGKQKLNKFIDKIPPIKT